MKLKYLLIKQSHNFKRTKIDKMQKIELSVINYLITRVEHV